MCNHPSTYSGERLPVVYGSAETEVCQQCSAWRYNLHGWSEWNRDQFLEDAILEAEADQNER